MDSLTQLALKYGTDKCPQNGHSYTPYYEELFKNKKVRKLLEIGIGYPGTMAHVPGYKIGASLFMWRDFFPQAKIYGCDLREETIFTDRHIETFICDQSKPAELVAMIDQIGSPDVIIDDGSHITEHQIISAKTLIPMLAKNGIYVIEDVKEPDRIKNELDYDLKVMSFLVTNPRDDRLVVYG